MRDALAIRVNGQERSIVLRKILYGSVRDIANRDGGSTAFDVKCLCERQMVLDDLVVGVGLGERNSSLCLAFIRNVNCTSRCG